MKSSAKQPKQLILETLVFGIPNSISVESKYVPMLPQESLPIVDVNNIWLDVRQMEFPVWLTLLVKLFLPLQPV